MKRIDDKQFWISIRTFLTEYLQNVRGKEENTVKAYRDTLNLYVGFLQKVFLASKSFPTLPRKFSPHRQERMPDIAIRCAA
ncbi:MAG: hypothetical protein WCP55_05260 [Lentisphaerota bacterium]